MNIDENFERFFELLTGNFPFPWQRKLFEELIDESFEQRLRKSCDIPTGLGKTSIMAIWLLALAHHANVRTLADFPRRLVYVVNRRTVVDQATREAERLREALSTKTELQEVVGILRSLCIQADGIPLAISTLRGQFADNAEWRNDPARPAVIVGTVDMVGSRLLFSGYGVGFKTKPLHAGFLGQDALLVHDEAHLEPAFQALLVEIEKEQWEGERSEQMPWPKLRVMELTATSRGSGAVGQMEKPFELTDAEKNPPDVIPNPPTEPIHHLWRRLKAKKAVHLREKQDEEKLADEIARLALEHNDDSGPAVVVFMRKVEDVEKVVKKLPKDSTVQLTGILRGLERDGLVKNPIFQRFLPESNRAKDVTPTPGTVYLVCTSAGEVGVNISADHMACDLSTFESMTQRFGRVNRFGVRDDTCIDIVPPKEFGKKDKNGKLKVDELDRRRQKTLELLKQLNGDASLAALGKVDPAARLAAFAPPPTILPATDILFDAWALTTIRGKLPGRPPVEPYLHGISEWQPPETHIAWRDEIEVINGPLLERYRPEDLLEDYPLKSHELLRDRSDRVFEHLQKIAAEHPDATVWIIDTRDSVEVTTLKKLTDGDKGAINHMTVLLPPLVGGLTQTGTLDGAAVRKKPKAGQAADATQITDADMALRYDVADEWYEDKDRTVKLRVRLWNDEPAPDGMTPEHKIKFETFEDEDAKPQKVWRWFVRKPEAANERSRRANQLQPHLDEVKDCASKIVRGLRLQNDIANAVILAAWFHDLGKKRERWQHSLGNDGYPSKVYAKSGWLPDGTKLRPREFLKDYRHEFGSLLDVLHGCNGSPPPADFAELSEEMKTLVLHLVAAHHGRGRPHFPVNEAFDPEGDSKAAAALAIETPRRFARLQRKYGRWGLAYLESLVRAADYAASANPLGTVGAPTEAEDQP